ATVKIHDLAVLGLAHTHVVHFADKAELPRKCRQAGLYRSNALRRGLATGKAEQLQRLQMRFHFDIRAELVADRGLKPRGDVMGGAKGKIAINLEIERDREPP